MFVIYFESENLLENILFCDQIGSDKIILKHQQVQNITTFV